jgi:DNA polymerase-3 subunit delta'
MSLKDFIGNASVIQTLESQLREDRLPNTLLFAGPSGIGKGTLARSLAKSLNCREVQYDFCNQCSSCRKIEANTHPDVRVYSPEGQFIKIDQMRELSREAFFRPFEGRQRIFILEQADRLKIEAANSILKTIEEPPESTTILLLSDKPNDLLSTIRSRAQLYQFIPLPFETMASWLAVETGRSKEDCQLLARLAGGALGKALQTDMDDYRQTRQESLDLLRSCRADFLYVRVGRILET